MIDAGLFFLILSSRYFLLIEKYQCWNMLRLMGALHHLFNGKVELQPCMVFLFFALRGWGLMLEFYHSR